MKSIAQNLYLRVGPDKQIKITLSKNIDELPEGQRKVAIAFTEYFDLIGKYHFSSPRKNHITLEMELNDRLPDFLNKESIVYQSNSVTFIRLNSQ